MKFLKLKFLFLFLLILVIIIPLTVLALNIDNYSKTIANKAGYDTEKVTQQDFLDTTIGKTIALVMGLVGIIFLILIIVSGIQWMTAGGNEDKVKQARARLIGAVIGLIIIMAAYTISFFVYKVISEASGGKPVGSPSSYFETNQNRFT